jgi:hypothetical protein
VCCEQRITTTEPVFLGVSRCVTNRDTVTPLPSIADFATRRSRISGRILGNFRARLHRSFPGHLSISSMTAKFARNGSPNQGLLTLALDYHYHLYSLQATHSKDDIYASANALKITKSPFASSGTLTTIDDPAPTKNTSPVPSTTSSPSDDRMRPLPSVTIPILGPPNAR